MKQEFFEEFNNFVTSALRCYVLFKDKDMYLKDIPSVTNYSAYMNIKDLYGKGRCCLTKNDMSLLELIAYLPYDDEKIGKESVNKLWKSSYDLLKILYARIINKAGNDPFLNVRSKIWDKFSKEYNDLDTIV